MSDKVFAGVIMALLFILILGGSLAFRAYAPCGLLNLLPAKDVPGRCLTVKVTQ